MKKMLLLFALLTASVVAFAQGPSTPITYPVSDPTGLTCVSTYALYQGRLFVCSANVYRVMPTVSNAIAGYVNYPFTSPAGALCTKNGTQDPPLSVFNGVAFSCQSSAYTAITAGGGGSPGGTNTQAQYNNGGTFGGFTFSGDITVVTSTGVATLATVNSGPGACGDATHVCAVTTDAKGRVVSQTSTAIAGGGAVSSVFTRTGAVVAAANDYSFAQLSGSASNAQLPAAISVTTVTASGAVTGSSFVGTAAGGVGNSWLAAEGTDPGTESTGNDLCWGDSAVHRVKCSFNNGTAAQLVKSGADINTSDQIQQLHEGVTAVNNAASPYTVLATDSRIRCDATAGNVTINLPAATGTLREIAYKKIDSTGNTCTFARAGSDLIDGQTSIVLNMQWQSGRIQDAASAAWDKLEVVAIPMTGGATGSTVASSTTQFSTITGLGAPATEAQRVVALPWNGILQHVCVSQGAQTSAAVTYTIREWTPSSATGADTAITWTVAISAAAGTYCDDTHQISITSTKNYDLKIAEGSGATTGAIYGISAVYIPTVF